MSEPQSGDGVDFCSTARIQFFLHYKDEDELLGFLRQTVMTYFEISSAAIISNHISHLRTYYNETSTRAYLLIGHTPKSMGWQSILSYL